MSLGQGSVSSQGVPLFSPSSACWRPLKPFAPFPQRIEPSSPGAWSMSVNLKPRRVSMNLPQHDSQAIGGAEGHCPCASCSDMKIPRRQSTEMNQLSLVYETPVKAQSTPDVSLDPKKDNGSVSPATKGEKTNDTLIQSRRANSTGQKQGTLMSWLKTSKNTGYLKTDMARDIGADMKRELGTDTKRHMETDTKANSRTTTNPASEQVFHVPEAAQCLPSGRLVLSVEHLQL